MRAHQKVNVGLEVDGRRKKVRCVIEIDGNKVELSINGLRLLGERLLRLSESALNHQILLKYLIDDLDMTTNEATHFARTLVKKLAEHPSHAFAGGATEVGGLDDVEIEDDDSDDDDDDDDDDSDDDEEEEESSEDTDESNDE